MQGLQGFPALLAVAWCTHVMHEQPAASQLSCQRRMRGAVLLPPEAMDMHARARRDACLAPTPPPARPSDPRAHAPARLAACQRHRHRTTHPPITSHTPAKAHASNAGPDLGLVPVHTPTPCTHERRCTPMCKQPASSRLLPACPSLWHALVRTRHPSSNKMRTPHCISPGWRAEGPPSCAGCPCCACCGRCRRRHR